MKGKLDFGLTLNEIFGIYGAQAGVLLPVAFWLFLVVAILGGLAGSSLTLLPLELIVSTIISTLYQGMVVGLVRDVQDGRRAASVGELMRSALPVVGPLIGAAIVSGIAIGIGLFLLIVPGLILMTIWAVIAPAIVIERTGVFAAFGRSRELVSGNAWAVFGVILVAYLITFAGALIFGGIASAVANGAIVRIVFSALASTITAPIPALAAGVLYYRLLPLQPAAAPPEPPSVLQ